MLKKIVYILFIPGIILWQACEDPVREAGFEDVEVFSIYDYIVENEEQFSLFLDILEKGGMDVTLSAYNPEGNGYTLFLPDNNAIEQFVSESELFSSLNDLLNDTEYLAIFSRYHVINMSLRSNDFPFGAFPEPTLSDDFLTVSFIIEPDTSYYRINNQATVVFPNIETANGYIHIIGSALTPITFTIYEWLEQNTGYSIFKEAVDLTGLRSIIDFDIKEDESLQPVTLLLEPDAIYRENGINSASDLAALISPDEKNYTDEKNAFNKFVAYHVLTRSLFLDDFEGETTNYNTHSDIPLNINGLGIDLAINKGKQVFDTIVTGIDTTLIDYIGFFYDESNVLTQNGAIHFIDRIMTQQPPSRTRQDLEFSEEPYINTLRKEAGTYLIEDPDALLFIEWSGADLYFVERRNENISAWGNDYLEISGDFEISYQTPEIIQGSYEVYLRAEAFNNENAYVEVFIDGKRISGLIDLSTGGSSNNPFQNILLGPVDFSQYESHKIEIKPLIPGRFLWDAVRFEPI
jgi:uncharacterized surface protein with fasciclin (FAS1) repeats